jgi:hypothetical protein
MGDRVYFACSLRGAAQDRLLRLFERALALFPHSRLARRGPALRVYAIDHAEPPALEQEFAPGISPAEIIALAREFFHPDCCLEVDTAWDLLQFDGAWELRPAPVTLACYGPEFDRRDRDDIRIDFGREVLFLPEPDGEGALRAGQANLQSLVRLLGELERALPLESRQLRTESGADFAGTVAARFSR